MALELALYLLGGAAWWVYNLACSLPMIRDQWASATPPWRLSAVAGLIVGGLISIAFWPIAFLFTLVCIVQERKRPR